MKLIFYSLLVKSFICTERSSSNTEKPLRRRWIVSEIVFEDVKTFFKMTVPTGWPENTDPRSVNPPTDPVHGLPYGSVHGPFLRTPLQTTPQKIAQKENKQKYKQKWQKDLTYHLNGLTARVGENSRVCFRKINRLGRKVILIAYFADLSPLSWQPWMTGESREY